MRKKPRNRQASEELSRYKLYDIRQKYQVHTKEMDMGRKRELQQSYGVKLQFWKINLSVMLPAHSRILSPSQSQLHEAP